MTHVDMQTRVGTVTFPNPVFTASGTSGYGAELGAYVDLASLGAVVVKSLSAEPWSGNAAPRVHETVAGMLNAVQQFAGAIGVAALGTVFFARAGHPSVRSYLAAAELVFGIAAGLYFVTLLLVGLLPRHAQQAPAEAV